MPFLKRLPYPIAVAWIALLAFSHFDSTAVSQENDRKKDSKGESSEKKKSDESDSDDSSSHATYWAPRKLQMKFGLSFRANDNYCSQIHATVPIPMQWPEQKVDIVATNISPTARYKLQPIQGGVLQLVIDAPAIPPGGSFDAILTIDVEKSFTKAPEDPSNLKIPKKLPKDFNWYTGDSPFIDTKDGAIKRIVAEVKGTEPANDWEYVEHLYDWVREHIEYRRGKLRSTKEAIKEKWGDCEEMTGIFVALCRASNIPARVVWIPEHCYAEFYLDDGKGNGCWFPCQLAGERQFGEMNEYRPILQKGDRFRVAEKKTMQRYVAEFFTCKQRPVGPREPEIDQIRDLGPLQQEIEQLRNAESRPKLTIDGGKEEPKP